MTAPSKTPAIRRREFLVRWNGFTLAGLAALPLSANLLAVEAAVPLQKRTGFPSPPPPSDPTEQDKNAPQGVDPQTAKRVMAAKNEKEFREGVQKLYDLATELRDELAQAPKMNVLSVRMYKKTEEIEKLAKQLKSKAKGG
jgi:hypothetical protein